MSVSPTHKPDNDKNFADIAFRPQPHPSTDKEPQPEQTKEAENKKEGTPSPEASAAPEKTASQATPPPDGGDEKKEQAGKANSWASVLLDALLVLILLGVIGGGGYYLKQELDRYRVPSAMEIALEENHQLSLKRESLQADYYHADEQMHMRKTLARLNSQLDSIKHEISSLEASIEDQKNNILAMQHEIRQADTDARSVARSLLPGMPIGTATTTTGKSIRNAVIYRLVNNKTIDIRSNEGQVRVPTKDLVKDTLPPMARYAFGLVDLVDMSDFGLQNPASAAPAPKQEARSQASSATAQPARQAETDYEPAAGAPVVDTDANKTSTTGTPEDPIAPAASSPTDSWQAPTGEMPL